MAAAGLGVNFAVAVALLSYLGHRLDQKLDSGIRWVLCGVLLGLAYGAYEVWKLVRDPGNPEANET